MKSNIILIEKINHTNYSNVLYKIKVLNYKIILANNQYNKNYIKLFPNKKDLNNHFYNLVVSYQFFCK